jgi:Uma2 family endonuclease
MSAIAHISLDEYERIVAAGVFERRRLEFIRGEIREMSPKGNRHEDMVDQLDEWSHEALRGKVARIRVQNSIRLPSLETLPEPDLTWVVRHRYSRRKPGPEDVYLVIEVAETSLEYDLGDKAELYAAAGIRDYWVVDLSGGRVVVHRDPAEGRYRTIRFFSGSEEVRPLEFPDVALRTDSLWDR